MRAFVKFSIILTLCVIIMGAYTRLTDAGLGCPDWPGCYGFLTVPTQAEQIEQAQQLFPDTPLENQKAWNEMIHRYIAGLLGIVILVIAIWSVMRARQRPMQPVKLPILLLLLVTFQAALGAWTVTMNLQPLIVMGHLLGGFSTFCLLYLLSLRLNRLHNPSNDYGARTLRGLALLSLLVVFGQIALGGWVAANYAAMTCTSLPICEGDWLNRLDVAGAFSVPEASTYQYGAHDFEERMTMHVAHRIGAIVVMLVVGWMLFTGYRRARSKLIRSSLNWVTLLLVIQVALGISNVVFYLPLSVAVLHNLFGVLLLASLVGLNYKLARNA